MSAWTGTICKTFIHCYGTDTDQLGWILSISYCFRCPGLDQLHPSLREMQSIGMGTGLPPLHSLLVSPKASWQRVILNGLFDYCWVEANHSGGKLVQSDNQIFFSIVFSIVVVENCYQAARMVQWIDKCGYSHQVLYALRPLHSYDITHLTPHKKSTKLIPKLTVCFCRCKPSRTGLTLLSLFFLVSNLLPRIGVKF